MVAQVIVSNEINSALQNINDFLQDLTPIFNDIGEHMLVSTRQNFDEETAPDGTPWTPLTEETITFKERKGKNRGILKFNLDLRDTIVYEASPRELAIGSNLPYAATHFFGDEDREIPARPYLGLRPEDESIILEIIEGKI